MLLPLDRTLAVAPVGDEPVAPEDIRRYRGQGVHPLPAQRGTTLTNQVHLIGCSRDSSALMAGPGRRPIRDKADALTLHAPTGSAEYIDEVRYGRDSRKPAPRARTLKAALFAIISTMGFAQRPQPDAITITLAGQSMIRSDIRTAAPTVVPVIQGLLKGDVVFTNLEAAVAEKGETVHEGRGFLTPPEALDALTTFGFNLLSLSGNHAFDLRATGIQNTIREADSRKIVHAGTGSNLAAAAAPGYLHTPKGTIALIASASGLITPGGSATADRPGVNELRVEAGDKENEATLDLPGAPGNTPNQEDSRRILQSIRDARRHADLVIVYQHNHVFGKRSFSTIFTEGMQERLAPNDWLRKWTHAEVDAGADIIVMHGAPLLHGVEIYRGRPILYDLGNFIYNVPPTLTYIDEPMNWESAVAYVQFQGKFQRRNLQSISFRPIALNNVGEGQPDIHNEYANNQFLDTRGLPSPATGARAGYILQRLADASKAFGTKLEIKGDTAVIKLKAAN
jgi:poly-gamma-glutamate capsule biosynthesis protein CapA/YwtB (metallophosphatase superfamily)